MFSTPVLVVAFTSLQLFVGLQNLFVTLAQLLVSCCVTYLAKMADKASVSTGEEMVRRGKEVVELHKAFNSGFGPFFLILFSQAQGICVLYAFISLTSLFAANSDGLTPCLVLGYFGLALGQAVNVLSHAIFISFFSSTIPIT